MKMDALHPRLWLTMEREQGVEDGFFGLFLLVTSCLV